MSEATPLLSELAANKSPAAKDVYGRFSTGQKRVILALASQAGLLSHLASGSFVPSVPKIAKDLNSTGIVINYMVGVYMFNNAIGGLVCAPYAGFYGRRPVYLVSLPILCVGLLGASVSMNVTQLAISRTFQGLGASCLVTVGAAVVSDIYRLEERGTAMGMFYGIVFLGPTLAPIFGGVLSTYCSWRMMQFFLFAMGCTSFAFIAALYPETSHPGTRGCDKLMGVLEESHTLSPALKCHWKWVWLNPFKSVIKILCSPNIFLAALATSLTLMTCFILIVPLSYTMGPQYGVTNPTLIGLCIVPSGIGTIFGATLGGRLSDQTVVRGLRTRAGKWVPEDRLRATIFGALLLVPLSVLVFGLTTQFVPGKLGLAINLVSLFMNGVGVIVVQSPTNTYTVDILHDRSAEVAAVMSAFRSLVSAFATAAVLPTINAIGVAYTYGIAGIMAWLAFGLLVVVIRYGDRLRALVDIGYTLK